MKAQVLTTTRSASAAERARVSPSPRRDAATLSESTAFLGQPSVSIQNRSPGRAAAAARREAPPDGFGDPMSRLAYRLPAPTLGASPVGEEGGLSAPAGWCPACGAEYTRGSRDCNDRPRAR